jgi:PAS domain S-box-containing protein
MYDAIIEANRDGRIQLMNDAAENLTGWHADDARGRPLAEVFQINGHARGPRRLGSALLTRDRRCVEIEGRAEGIRDSLGGLREIRIQFARRVPVPVTCVPPLDAA